MIDMDAPTPVRSFADRPPTTVSHAARGPIERRGRRSGQVSVKTCPRCNAVVALDVRRMAVDAHGPRIVCDMCRGRVPVRRVDLSRPAPAGPPEDRAPKGWRWALRARRDRGRRVPHASAAVAQHDTHEG